MVQRRRPVRLRLDATNRKGCGSVDHRSARSGIGQAARRASKAAAGQPLDFSPDDRQLVAMNWVSINETYLWLVDVATGEKTLLTPKNGTGDGRLRGRPVQPRRQKNLSSPRIAIRSIIGWPTSPSDEKRHVYLTNDVRWDVSQFEVSWDGSDHRLRFQRGRSRRSAIARHGDGRTCERNLKSRSGSSAACTGTRTIATWGSIFSIRDAGSDAYSLDVTTGKTGTLDIQRNGRNQYRRVLAAGARSLEVVRRPPITGWLSRPPGQVPGQATGDHSNSWRSGRPRPAPGFRPATATW